MVAERVELRLQLGECGGAGAGGEPSFQRLVEPFDLFPALVGTGMLAMLIGGGSGAGLFIAAALWGLGFGGVPTAVLTWGARVEPNRLEQIGALIVTVCNVAIAVGAVAGGILVDSISARAPLAVGAVGALLGAAVLVALRVRSRVG